MRLKLRKTKLESFKEKMRESQTDSFYRKGEILPNIKVNYNLKNIKDMCKELGYNFYKLQNGIVHINPRYDFESNSTHYSFNVVLVTDELSKEELVAEYKFIKSPMWKVLHGE